MTQKVDQEITPDGMVRQVFEEDGELFTKRAYDAEPLLKQLAEERVQSRGSNWNHNMVKLGTIPPNVYAQMLLDGRANDPAAMALWLEQNPLCKSVEKTYALKPQSSVIIL